MIDPEREFSAIFGEPATHVVEAPGRVNLIGDHTDYNDLPVLPVAIGERVRLWVRPRNDGRVHVRSDWAPERVEDFHLGERLPARDSGDWRNYVQAATSGVEGILPEDARGFDGLVSSDVPPASGLSSSSAVVVAVIVALLRLNEVELGPLETAAVAARAERFVGTAGGGMDQAIALCGRSGHAIRIDFAPLRVEPVAVPAEWRFVCAFSGENAEKSGPVQGEYNERVASCRSALERVGEVIGVDRALSYPALLSTVPILDLLDIAKKALGGNELRRFRHTVTEAVRVDRAVRAMREGDAEMFGALMSQSHASLRDDYDVSTSLLDDLVASALGAGALGARLTGAGFGGSIVALARPETVLRVTRALTNALPNDPDRSDPARLGAGRVFRIDPSDGATFRRR